jgi:hypothetical protein
MDLNVKDFVGFVRIPEGDEIVICGKFCRQVAWIVILFF